MLSKSKMVAVLGFTKLHQGRKEEKEVPGKGTIRKRDKDQIKSERCSAPDKYLANPLCYLKKCFVDSI